MLVAPTELPLAAPTTTGSAFSLLPTVPLNALPMGGTPAPGQPDPAAQPRRPVPVAQKWAPRRAATPAPEAEAEAAPEPATPPPAAVPEPAPAPPPPPPAPTGKQKNAGIDDGF
jgi:hypothetical protein